MRARGKPRDWRKVEGWKKVQVLGEVRFLGYTGVLRGRELNLNFRGRYEGGEPV